MSKAEPTPTKKLPKKQALGRGLGSLLGGNSDDDENKDQAEQQQESKQTKSQASQEAKPKSPGVKVHYSVEKDKSLGEGIKQSSATTQTHNTQSQPAVADPSRIWQIPVEKLKAQRNQPRKDFDSDAIKELAASIKEQGILQPIVARRNENKEFEIIAGERRWRAAQSIGLERVPVILKLTDEQKARELALIENIQREDLNPVEEAEAFDSLIKKYQLTQQELADRLGKDRASVANSLRLLKLHPDLRTYLKAGELSSGQAKVLLSVADPKIQKKIGFQVLKKKLTVRDTEKLVSKARNQEAMASDPASMRDLDVSNRLIKGLGEEIQKILKTKVAIDYKNGKGKIKIHFHSDVELDQIVDKIKCL